MLIRRIIHKDYHDPVYRSLDNDSFVKARLGNPPDFMEDAIGFSRKNSHITNLGLRVAAISSRHSDVMNARMGQEFLVESLGHLDLDGVLERIRDCYPGGAVEKCNSLILEYRFKVSP